PRSGWTRREALGMLGMGAAAAALPEFAFAADLTFPKGAVIRTVLKDYAPEELAGAATLFHEHMSFADDFMIRWNGFSAATRAANAPPNPAGRTGGAAGAGGAGGAGRAGGAADAAGAGAGRAGAAGAAGGGRAGGAAAPPAGPYFMRDADLMTE